MKNNLIYLFLFITSSVISQENTISGYIQDKSSGEQLIGANIVDIHSGKGATTNAYGYYSLSLDHDTLHLVISYVGYQSIDTLIIVKNQAIRHFELKPSIDLEEVVISSAKIEKIQEKSQMSSIEVPIEQIRKVPALLGEVDVMKALQLLPGVQSGGEGQSGLYVRGGSPDQNLILLDGVPIYNASHLFGFFSVFNADAIKDVSMIKGGYPARYGGRLSSVMDIRMKEGNKQALHGSATIGLVASKLTLEGPITRGKTSFLLSGRRTYIDLLAKPFIQNAFEEEGNEGGTGYYFYDINAKMNHHFSDKDKIYLSFYGGDDKFYFDQKELEGSFRDFTESDFGWGNITAAMRWNHIWHPKLFSNSAVTYSRYSLGVKSLFGIESDIEDKDEFIAIDYGSGIRDLAVKIDFDFIPNPEYNIRFGLHGIRHHFIPGNFLLEQKIEAEDFSFERTVGQEDIYASEWSLYMEDDILFNNHIKANVGIHLSAFHVDGDVYHSFQPRLGMRYLLNDEMSFKFSFATMRQYIQLLAFEGVGLPTDLWLPTTSRVKPQDSWQAAIGVAHGLGDYEFSVEAYYKEMKNLISYKNGESIFALSDWQDRVTQGDGKSYGAELLIQKKTGRLNGWIGYTLSWSHRTFPDLNLGESFPFKYDRRHDISIVANYQLDDQWHVSTSWVYGTGNAVTLGNSQYYSIFGHNYFTGQNIAERNGYRMRSYHRLDWGLNWVKKKRSYTRTWSFGAYNTYSRQNPFYVYIDDERIRLPNGQIEEETKLKQVSLFPIIPYISYKIDF